MLDIIGIICLVALLVIILYGLPALFLFLSAQEMEKKVKDGKLKCKKCGSKNLEVTIVPMTLITTSHISFDGTFGIPMTGEGLGIGIKCKDCGTIIS